MLSPPSYFLLCCVCSHLSRSHALSILPSSCCCVILCSLPPVYHPVHVVHCAVCSSAVRLPSRRSSPPSFSRHAAPGYCIPPGLVHPSTALLFALAVPDPVLFHPSAPAACVAFPHSALAVPLCRACLLRSARRFALPHCFLCFSSRSLSSLLSSLAVPVPSLLCCALLIPCACASAVSAVVSFPLPCCFARHPSLPLPLPSLAAVLLSGLPCQPVSCDPVCCSILWLGAFVCRTPPELLPVSCTRSHCWRFHVPSCACACPSVLPCTSFSCAPDLPVPFSCFLAPLFWSPSTRPPISISASRAWGHPACTRVTHLS